MVSRPSRALLAGILPAIVRLIRIHLRSPAREPSTRARTRLDARFDREALGFWPYYFADLAGTSEADEQAAIDGGLIRANRIQYAGRRAIRVSAAS